MKNANAPEDWTTRRIPPIACATALAVAFTLSLPQPAHAGDVTPPPVPDKLQVPEGAEAFLVGHARGTQNYVCLPSATGASPGRSSRRRPPCSATAASRSSPTSSPPTRCEPNTNPRVVADGTIRAAWQYSDTSTVWAAADPAHTATFHRPRFRQAGCRCLAPLTVVGAKDGPTGGDTLSDTTFVQRVNTSGGLAPSTGCSSLADVGKAGVHALHGRLLLLRGPRRGRPTPTRTPATSSVHKACGRTGRHSRPVQRPGLGVCDGGLVIDLSPVRGQREHQAGVRPFRRAGGE